MFIAASLFALAVFSSNLIGDEPRLLGLAELPLAARTKVDIELQGEWRLESESPDNSTALLKIERSNDSYSIDAKLYSKGLAVESDPIDVRFWAITCECKGETYFLAKPMLRDPEDALLNGKFIIPVFVLLKYTIYDNQLRIYLPSAESLDKLDANQWRRARSLLVNFDRFESVDKLLQATDMKWDERPMLRAKKIVDVP